MSSELFNLPHLDEDGYFDGFVCCQNGEDGAPLLPADVVNAKAPADDPKEADSFYKWDSKKKAWQAEKKPTTAAECAALGPVDHYSQTDRVNALRQLYQKLTEGSTDYRIARGEKLEWIVEKIPEKTLDELKAEKTQELDSAFMSWYTDGATMKSSLGFEADSDQHACIDVSMLVVAAEAQATYAEAGLEFRDAKNVNHPVTLDQLKVLQLEIGAAGKAAYDYKWKTGKAIADAKTKEDLAKITIKFVPADFSKA